MPRPNRVRHSGKRLEVATLDLSGSLDDLLANVQNVATRAVGLRDEARGRGSIAFDSPGAPPGPAFVSA